MRVSDLLAAIAPLLEIDRAAGKDAPQEFKSTQLALEHVADMVRRERDALPSARRVSLQYLRPWLVRRYDGCRGPNGRKEQS